MTPTSWHSTQQKWREAGASHISFNTMGAGLQGVDEHINAISLFASQLM